MTLGILRAVVICCLCVLVLHPLQGHIFDGISKYEPPNFKPHVKSLKVQTSEQKRLLQQMRTEMDKAVNLDYPYHHGTRDDAARLRKVYIVLHEYLPQLYSGRVLTFLSKIFAEIYFRSSYDPDRSYSVMKPNIYELMRLAGKK